MFWNCTWRTGLDELGKPARGPIACCLWSKGPKEGLERADDTFGAFRQTDGQLSAPRGAVWLYRRPGKAGRGAPPRIWSRTPVPHSAHDAATGKFIGTVHDLKNDHVCSEEFDHVVVASGHFFTPNVPGFPGLDTFNGRALHAMTSATRANLRAGTS